MITLRALHVRPTMESHNDETLFQTFLLQRDGERLTLQIHSGLVGCRLVEIKFDGPPTCRATNIENERSEREIGREQAFPEEFAEECALFADVGE